MFSHLDNTIIDNIYIKL